MSVNDQGLRTPPPGRIYGPVLNTEPMQGSCQARAPGSSAGAHVHRSMCMGCGWTSLQFRLEDANDLRSSHPVERVSVPAPLNHVPHSIRHFRTDRSRRSVVVEHGKDYSGFDLASERRLPSEELRSTRADEYPETGRKPRGLPPTQAYQTQTHPSLQ